MSNKLISSKIYNCIYSSGNTFNKITKISNFFLCLRKVTIKEINYIINIFIYVTKKTDARLLYAISSNGRKPLLCQIQIFVLSHDIESSLEMYKDLLVL